ncbi:DUF2971 domain-containing protein [Aeromonas media]|uniref:DUF2971 domain-containing protein n=1 Tax=Aeromonas media TaxID=651 RepID=UPI003D049109
MKKVYKYYQSKFDLESYLKSPNIRITQLNILNDPFEGVITQTVLDTLIEKISPVFTPEIGENIYPIDEEAKLHIQMQIDALGITSFSETSRNLLMWSHYASEHKGICIGYKNPLTPPPR